MNDETAVPVFAAGVKLRFDSVREAWVVLAPERLLLPDEQALEILQLVDSEHSLGTIINNLAARYAAPRALIAADVATLLDDLADKGVLRWRP